MKKYLLLIASSIFAITIMVAPTAHAAILFDASSSYSTTVNISVATTTHTVGAGSNMLLVCSAGGSGPVITATTTFFSYNGTQMTFVTSTISSRTGAVWYLLNPTAGSHIVSATIATANMLEYGCNSFSGVSAFDGANAINGSAASTTNTIPTHSGDVIVDVIGTHNATSTSATLSSTVIIGGSSAITVGYAFATTTTSKVGWTINGGSTAYGEAGASFLATTSTVNFPITADVTINNGTTVMRGVTIN